MLLLEQSETSLNGPQAVEGFTVVINMIIVPTDPVKAIIKHIRKKSDAFDAVQVTEDLEQT